MLFEIKFECYLNVVVKFSSLELVENLYHKYLHSVKSYQTANDKAIKFESDLNAAQQQLFPLRKEIAKIQRENHMLRTESLRLKDIDLVSYQS